MPIKGAIGMSQEPGLGQYRDAPILSERQQDGQRQPTHRHKDYVSPQRSGKSPVSFRIFHRSLLVQRSSVH